MTLDDNRRVRDWPNHSIWNQICPGNHFGIHLESASAVLVPTEFQWRWNTKVVWPQTWWNSPTVKMSAEKIFSDCREENRIRINGHACISSMCARNDGVIGQSDINKRMSNFVRCNPCKSSKCPSPMSLPFQSDFGIKQTKKNKELTTDQSRFVTLNQHLQSVEIEVSRTINYNSRKRQNNCI